MSRYIWLLDTLNTHGCLSREQISELWKRSSLGNGDPLPERTFYNYRRAIEDIFKIEIACNRRGEYYVESELNNSNGVADWLLDSYAVNSILADSPDIGDRIEVEEVPSAREFLPIIIKSLREGVVIRFDYAGFNRSITEKCIEIQPYFLKRYKQRWYMIGKRVRNGDIRTYALDRIKKVEPTGAHFRFPASLSLQDLFGNVIGITTSKADERIVRLRATRTQAKYLRALPLHRSQVEELVSDHYSIFSYRLKLNYELVHELMSLGDGVTVLEPKELRIMVVNELRKALAQYDTPRERGARKNSVE